jgi:hypothetical protein
MSILPDPEPDHLKGETNTLGGLFSGKTPEVKKLEAAYS